MKFKRRVAVSVTVKESREEDNSKTPQSFSGSYPSPGTSLSLSPSAWSWLEKLTNSAPSSLSWGRFLRSFAMARRAALSSLLRSSSLFLLLRTGFGVCFLDMLATVVSVGQQHDVCLLTVMSWYLHQPLPHIWNIFNKHRTRRVGMSEYVKRCIRLDILYNDVVIFSQSVFC